MKPALPFFVFLVVLASAVPDTRAATLSFQVTDAAGTPLEDAVVWAVPKGEPPRPRREAAVEQKDRRFVPKVTVVQTGTLVSFPNRDEIRHHVYSFSPPKNFEIKLYAGTPAAPVLFDKPGEVVLGCNIHDDMIAWIYVVDSPWFAKTGKDGRAKLEDVPAGEYEARAWHPSGAKVDTRALRVRADEAVATGFALPLKVQPARPAPK